MVMKNVFELPCYTIRYWPFDGASAFSAQFEIFEVSWVDDNNQRIYGTQLEFSDSMDKAKPVVSGSVKWDGCINVDLSAEDHNVMAHFCGFDHLKRYTEALEKAYELAALSIPNRDPGLQNLP